MEITEVRIKLMEDSGERLQAFCSITFDDCFVIRDLKIIEGTNGPFVAMPSRKLTAHCPQCGCKNHLKAAHCNQCGLRLKDDRTVKDEDGRTKLYADIAHPINSACREMIQERVIRRVPRRTRTGQAARLRLALRRLRSRGDVRPAAASTGPIANCGEPAEERWLLGTKRRPRSRPLGWLAASIGPALVRAARERTGQPSPIRRAAASPAPPIGCGCSRANRQSRSSGGQRWSRCQCDKRRPGSQPRPAENRCLRGRDFLMTRQSSTFVPRAAQGILISIVCLPSFTS